MKKIIILIFLAIFLNLATKAQFQYGIKAGGGWWQIRNNFSSTLSSATTTYNLGFIVKYNFPVKKFSLISGLEYSFLEKNSGYILKPLNHNLNGPLIGTCGLPTFRYNQFSVPIDIAITKWKLEYFAGLKYDYRTYNKDNETYIMDNLNLNIGINYKITNKWMLGFEYVEALKPDFSNLEYIYYTTSYTETIFKYWSRQYYFLIKYTFL